MVDLLRGLQEKRGLSYLFISHDLKVVKALASQIVVLRDGKIVEQGDASEIFANPREKYTKALFAAAFDLDARPAGGRACGVGSKNQGQMAQATKAHRGRGKTAETGHAQAEGAVRAVEPAFDRLVGLARRARVDQAEC